MCAADWVDDHEYRDDMRTLLERKILDVNAQGENGDYPLRIAVKKGHRDFVLLLLEHGADPNLRDAKIGEWMTPLRHLCSAKPEDYAISQSFAGVAGDAGNPRYRGVRGQAEWGFIYRSRQGDIGGSLQQEGMFQALVDYGADFEIATDVEGKTALHLAAANGDINTENILFHYVTDPVQFPSVAASLSPIFGFFAFLSSVAILHIPFSPRLAAADTFYIKSDKVAFQSACSPEVDTRIMRAYIGIKFYPDDRTREPIELVSQALTSCGFDTVCVQRDLEKWGVVTLSPRELMSKTFEIIRDCHFIVINLTEKGVGLGIEAGCAYAQSLPVITIARDGSDISDTLRGISQAVYLYRSVADLREIFTQLGKVLQE
ncbi:uncharacterized protein PAC_15898 [Phialocephala subalpina]|uniref:Uncharacterized protein n=1 Tax=Phialocephala subalpina TaxID=576137 RepID=A0A1L7XLV6_9HELO|nr:uncharacterized protein PAC_15898 [Phialocephala subalpina]